MARSALVPSASAASAGLRYISDRAPGIRRLKAGRAFRYVAPDGRVVRTSRELARIASLAIPPAWTDVWIAPDPRGHLQATGRDARGRKQYRYHADWRTCRDETKYDRLQEFASALPRIRARTSADLARPGLTREKVLAAVVQLLERTLIRIGNDEYARENGSYGLTTLRDAHVEVSGGRVRFQFRGKSGKRHAIAVSDRRLARIVKQCRDLPGQELFQYLDDHGRRQDVTSSDVNAYLKDISGHDYTAKEFRTWFGTVLAATALRTLGPASSQSRAKKQVLEAIEAVAGVLGNTRAVCRKSYIHPVVIDAYMDGTIERDCKPLRAIRLRGLRPDELATLALLRRRCTERQRERRAA